MPGFRRIAQNRLQDFDRYKEHGLAALSDRSRRPVRYANQLPQPIARLIVRLKADKQHWGLARSASSWSGGSMGTSGFRPKAPSMRFSTVTVWSSAAAGRATAGAAWTDATAGIIVYRVKTKGGWPLYFTFGVRIFLPYSRPEFHTRLYGISKCRSSGSTSKTSY